MAGKLRLVVVTPEGKTFDDDVEQVVMPGVEGQLGILPGHVPLLTAIQPGELDLKAGSRGDELAVGGGFAEITADRVTASNGLNPARALTSISNGVPSISEPCLPAPALSA